MISFIIRRPVSTLAIAFYLAAMICGRNLWLLGTDPEPATVTSDALVNTALSLSHTTANWWFISGFLVIGLLIQFTARLLDA